MEISFGQILTVGIGVAVNLVIYVVWQVRNEGKITLLIKESAEIKTDSKELWKEIEHHKTNADIHFSLQVSNQVQKRTDEKFAEIEKQLTKMDSSWNEKLREIKDTLKQMAEKK